MPGLPYIHDDGGRAAAGFKGKTGDCVARSIAIATQQDYIEVYNALNAEAQKERPRGGRSKSSARTGVKMATIQRYLKKQGWTWTPTMHIGSGTTVHLTPDELPMGRIIVRVSKHLCAVVDRVVHDTHDPSRDGTRAVYGYWAKEA